MPNSVICKRNKSFVNTKELRERVWEFVMQLLSGIIFLLKNAAFDVDTVFLLVFIPVA